MFFQLFQCVGISPTEFKNRAVEIDSDKIYPPDMLA